MIQPFGKQGEPLNIQLPYDPAILLLANQVGDRKQIGGGEKGNHKNENPDYSGGFMSICVKSKLNKLYTVTYAVYYVCQIYLNKTKGQMQFLKANIA